LLPRQLHRPDFIQSQGGLSADASDEVPRRVCSAQQAARCGGKLRIFASIGQPEVIAKILSHL
jgi:hypothetical protein